MGQLKAIEQATFGGVDSRSNPVNMPINRWLRCRNWVPKPNGHLELREGYQLRALGYVAPPTPSEPGTPINPALEMNHNVSANAAYNRTNFAANFSGISYISQAGATVFTNTALMDDSMNPITPAHVAANSMANMHQLIPNYQTTPTLAGPRYFAHWTPWFQLGGGGGHINIGLSSTDPNWVDSALSDMQNRGFNGLIIDWYGHGTTTDNSTLLVQPRVAVHGFVYAIMIDGGAYSTTAQLQTHLAYLNTQYLGDPNYLTMSGHPVVFFFGTVSGVDYATAKASVSRTMFWCFEGPNMTPTYVDGTFGWPNPWHDDPANHPGDPYNLAADNSYLTQVSGSGNKPCMPHISPGFNGTLTKSVAWSQGKYMARDYGKCWLTKCANLNSRIPPNMFGVQVATWNDWEEGTQLETPIDNGITVTSYLTGSIFQWTIAGGTNDESTILSYRVIADLGNGSAFLIHTENPGGSKTLDLSTLAFEVGVPYSIYVIAVGIACVRCQMSTIQSYTNTAGGGAGGGGGAAYSPVAYTVATPAQSSTPPMYPNGTRCMFYWQETAPSQAQTNISVVNWPHITGVPAGTPILATYQVASTARFLQGHNVTVSGVTGDPTSPWSPNGTFQIQAIGIGTITLIIGTDPGSGGGHLVHPPYQGTGGSMTAVDESPGAPEPLLMALLQAGGGGTPVPVKGKAILSTARWHYALGKDGYLYMHNGTDAKFFDGAWLRDIGLPFPTDSQLAGITIAQGFAGPDPRLVSQVTFHWSTGGTLPALNTNNLFYYAFFDTSNDELAVCETPLGGGYATVGTSGAEQVALQSLPVSSKSSVVGLVGININNAPGGRFLTITAGNPSNTPVSYGAQMHPYAGPGAGPQEIELNTSTPFNANIAVGSIIALDSPSGGSWPSSGPFTVQRVLSSNDLTFNCPPGVNKSLYTAPVNGVTMSRLLSVPSGGTSVTVNQDDELTNQGIALSTRGVLQLPFVEDSRGGNFIPASTVGGDQPGYQFWCAIYNPQTGHVGNRVPLGGRIANLSQSTFILSGLPDLSTQPPDTISAAAYYGYGANNINGGGNAAPLPPSTNPIPLLGPIPLLNYDSEWELLIGRTADGGEVPYACIDSNGNWITTTSASQASITISNAGIDNNSELPTTNYPPPPFVLFWREGDRICGGIMNQPFVYRSASEIDATTGIFVGNPAQCFDPSKVETFPTGEPIVGGFGCMQESWVYTRNDVAQLSELSGEVSWNGPYTHGFGGAGSWAFDKGWNSLPFWVSHDKQLCTMLPDGNGPISISTEYETALLAKIGNDYDAGGNQLRYMAKTEVVYFRDPQRLIDVLRIRCFDANGDPFTVIHDFNLRDESSPYGQGYEEVYLGPLANDYQSIAIRDHYPLPRVWATASDGNIYQFYTGGLDNVDLYNPLIGEAYTADAIGLRYISGERTAVKTIEWYGDELIQWYIYESLTNVIFDSTTWVNLSFEMRPVPGETGNAHWMSDLNRPEMMHCYLWAQLVAHPFDAPDPGTPMALNDPPHIPLENYGRLYLAAPLLGDTRGR